MISIIKKVMYIAMAGTTALVILSVLCSFISISPVHIPNDGGNTDYTWPGDSLWVCMTEGTGYGRFDANGFNNEAVVDNPDILILGSSHTEAKNVPQGSSYAALLGEEMAGQYTVYNMGISGHTLYKVCQYLETSLTMFEKVPEYVVIETDNVALTEEGVRQVLNHTVEYTPSHHTGVIAWLQKIPFFHLLYGQMDGLAGLLIADSGTAEAGESSLLATAEQADAEEAQNSADPYETLLGYVGELQEEYGTRIIILYHPEGELKEDGTIYFEESSAVKAFAGAAERHGILFADMKQDFEEMYYKEHHVAHGFENTELCYGHLNRYGHAAIAERLAKVIREDAGDAE